MAGVTLTLAAVLLQSVVYVVSDLTVQLALLDVDGEQTVFSWMASSVTFSVGLACVLLAVSGRGRGLILLPLAGFFAFMSLDDAIAIHERIGIRIADLLDLSSPWDRDIWPAVYLPLLLAVLALLLAAVRAAPRNASRLARIGLGCLGAAVLLEMISAPLFSLAAGAFTETLEIVVEEGLELGGWGLIATGLLSWFGSPRRAETAQPRLVSPA